MNTRARHIQQVIRKRDGQTTVEAAYLIPLLFLLFLLLCQPIILLYNHMIMNGAAAEGCRLLATRTSVGSYSDDKYEGYIKRQQRQLEELSRMEDRILPEDIDYNALQGLRIEARQKLSNIRPRSLGQATRISGVSPADAAALMIYLKK